MIKSSSSLPQVGDIWLVKFHPGTGQELAKYRPAVIVTNLSTIDDRFTLIAPLTSDITIRNPFELLIAHQALEKPSLLLCWYLWTIDQRRLYQKLGELSDVEIKKITEKIDQLFR